MPIDSVIVAWSDNECVSISFWKIKLLHYEKSLWFGAIFVEGNHIKGISSFDDDFNLLGHLSNWMSNNISHSDNVQDLLCYGCCF